VVGYEVEEEVEPAVGEPLAKPGQRWPTSVLRRHVVGLDGEGRAGDVLVAEIGKILGESCAPVGPRARDRAGGRPGGPHAEEPDPEESLGRELIEERVGNVVEGSRSPECPAPLGEQHAGVDLEEQGTLGMLGLSHDGPSPARAPAPPRALSSRSVWLAPQPRPVSPWKYSVEQDQILPVRVLGIAPLLTVTGAPP